MPETPIAIVWFRQDLRLADNPALHAAARSGAAVLPIFIHDDDEAGDWKPGSASRWWLRKSIASLDESLQGNLRVYRGSARDIIPRLVRDTGAEAIYWNRCVEPWRVSRDRSIKEQLLDAGTPVHTFNGSYLYEPAEVAKADGTPYRVFTPFWRHLRTLTPSPPIVLPDRAPIAPEHVPDSLDLEELALLPKLDWADRFPERWDPTLDGAADALSGFLDDRVQRYGDRRDRPALRGTSRLSPYLAHGQLGPRQVWDAVHTSGASDTNGGFKFLSEIAWREFAYHLLVHFPHTPTDALNESYRHFPWEPDEALLEAWQRGRTGYPIVDAGMRELWHTGWMHNRVRMIVASFLVKDLMIPWQRGADWFLDTLVDADLANNSASWQWVAGCGADAAPYFRIFNPITQSRKFDPDGEYIRRWIPELKNLNAADIHSPWTVAPLDLAAAGVTLNDNYPSPIVDHSLARQRTLDAYGQARGEKP